MAAYTLSLGKGLYEPCSPYRSAYFFGAELSSVRADGWNCLPRIADSTTSFDLAALPKNREVAVALINISGIAGLHCTVTFKWYRARDNTLLFTSTYRKDVLWWKWMYAYSYIGYLSDIEISENGDYFVHISVTGDISYSRTLHFTVSGVQVVEPEPVPPIPGLPIIEAFNSVSTACYSVYVEVLDWVFPFFYLAGPFYELAYFFSNLAWRFSSFFTWLDTTIATVTDILTWDTIWSYIKSYVPNLEQIRDWFYYWTGHVWQEINEWWLTVSSTVLGWVDEAKQYTWEWVESLLRSINNLQSSWDTFVTVTIPTIPSWLNIESLIKSWFADYTPFWEGWQDWRDKVAEFFSDPEDWLYKRLDSFFERFW